MREHQTISFYRRHLPHWTVKDGVYFVTIRQKDSIPVAAAKRIRAKIQEFENLPECDQLALRRLIFVEFEKWLDAGNDNAILATDNVADIITEAIRFRSETGIWRMVEYVIMPTHIHMFFAINHGSLKSVLASFKRKTSRDVKRILNHEKSLWHRESFDHWSRSEEYDKKIVRYIRNNPVKAGLVANYRDWPFGSWK